MYNISTAQARRAHIVIALMMTMLLSVLAIDMIIPGFRYDLIARLTPIDRQSVMKHQLDKQRADLEHTLAQAEAFLRD